MNTNQKVRPETADSQPRGRGEKYLAILLITLSVVGLLATPSSLRWLILLEGSIGIAGVLLFIHARLRFWREIAKKTE